MSEPTGSANWCSAAEVGPDWVCGKCGAKPSPSNPIGRWLIDDREGMTRCDFCHPHGAPTGRMNPNCTCATQAPTMPVFRSYTNHKPACPAFVDEGEDGSRASPSEPTGTTPSATPGGLTEMQADYACAFLDGLTWGRKNTGSLDGAGLSRCSAVILLICVGCYTGAHSGAAKS